jgi:hypothetical protein
MASEGRMGKGLVLHTSDGPVSLAPDALLVFVDETGADDLKDPHHPVFGLGGCVVLARQYLPTIHDPWMDLRRRCFPDWERRTLHASSLQPTPAQLEALSAFFVGGAFARVAALLSKRTELSVPAHRYELTALALLNRINKVAPAFWPFSSVHVMIESSTRGDPLAARYLAGYQEVRVEVEDKTHLCPVQKYFATKSAGLAGLEVADFIVQAAGASVRLEASHPGRGIDRLDFRAVFRSVPRHLASYLDIRSAAPKSDAE